MVMINCFTYSVKKDSKEIGKGYIHAQSKNGAMGRFNSEKAKDYPEFDHVDFAVTKCKRCFSTDDVANIWERKTEHVLCRDCRVDMFSNPIKYL
jgi:hypothetical protein